MVFTGEVARPPDRWRPVRWVAVAAYVVGYVVWFERNGIIIDRISVLLSVALLLMLAHLGRPAYRWRRLAVDLTAYSVMWLAYEETRGAADRLGMPLQVESVRNLDRLLFLGTDPTVWLQRTFYSPDVVRWYDVVASITYYTHFVVPVAVIAVVWIADRRGWMRVMARFATVLAVACVSFVLLPTAPPWMAAGGDRTIRLDALEPLARPAGRGWQHLDLDAFVRVWETGREWVNRVAAMPSLHAAFSLFVVLVIVPHVRSRAVRVALFGYPAAMGISLVYLAEHYVVDVLAGWVLVVATFAMWDRIERRYRDAAARRARAALATDETLAGDEALAAATADDRPATDETLAGDEALAAATADGSGPARPRLVGRRRVYLDRSLALAATDAEHPEHPSARAALLDLVEEWRAGRSWLVTDHLTAGELGAVAPGVLDVVSVVPGPWFTLERLPRRACDPGERVRREEGVRWVASVVAGQPAVPTVDA